MCKALGLSTAHPTNWKNGVEPSIRTLKRIADYFGISVEKLLEDEEIIVSASNHLSDEELQLLEAYRSATPERKESVKLLLGIVDDQRQSN